MNERIKELAEQANIFYTKHYDLGSVVVNREEVQKFAELIVRECMNNLYLHGYDDARTQIQEHFGVEE